MMAATTRSCAGRETPSCQVADGTAGASVEPVGAAQEVLGLFAATSPGEPSPGVSATSLWQKGCQKPWNQVQKNNPFVQQDLRSFIPGDPPGVKSAAPAWDR